MKYEISAVLNLKTYHILVGLLAQFIAQNTELTGLQNEAATLETELDALVAQFDQASKTLGNCNKN